MALSLSVPLSTRPLPPDVETNPKKARVWIDSLPLTKSVESAQQLTRTIEALNHAKLSADDRAALVDVYRPVIAVLLDELEAVFAYSSLPLPAKQKEAFELATALLVQCAYAYKMLVLEKSGKRVVFGAKKNQPGPVFWAMRFLGEQMMQCYKTYYPVPPGVWQELHSLFLHAEAEGMLGESGDAEASQSIMDVYVDGIMTALADPYRLMNREIERTLEILKQNRGLVDFRTSAEGLNPQRLFVVALDSDEAPRVLVQGGKPPAGQVLRIVDPGRLVEKLEQRARAQSMAGTPAGNSRTSHGLADLLSRLIRLWGDPPKRQFRRNPADSSAALCSGVKALCYFTELTSNEDPEADAKAIREGRTIPLLKIPRDPMSQMIGVEEWHVLNQSANGLRMHRESGGNVAVTVGEVVGVRFIGGRSWNVGVVRWLTLLEGNALEFGVELIAPAAISSTIEPTIGATGKPAPALMLLPLPPDEECDTVITPAETFSDLREFELNAQGDLLRVRATTLIERTGRFDLFQFQSS